MPVDQQTTASPDHETAHLIGMCQDWAWSPMLEGEPGAGRFIMSCRDAMVRQRDEIARLRAALRKIGERAPDADTLGVQPGFDYWCSVAERRLQIAREAMPDERF